ncbi:sensor histidine kinase [Solimonas soli]|uniref:sensor histidine kinase n=1 Tax=Solimonas soli TaxID=413479 RepID=UPI0004BACDDC|nr:sensor histidine kinase N-terminal domain-containing protein [Solimonas soli]
MTRAPSWWSTRTLHGRLRQRLLLIVTLIIGAAALGSYVLARQVADRVFDAWLRDASGSLAAAVGIGQHFDDADVLQALEREVRFDETDDVQFMVADGGGVLAGRADLPMPAQMHGDGPLLYDATVDGYAVRAVWQRAQQPHGGFVTIVVTETLRKRRVLAGELLFAALLPALLLAGVAIALLNVGVDRALAPLDALGAALARQDPLRLEPFPEDGPVEIQPLLRTLNALLARLNGMVDTQRRFVADTAHQLRNPLTGLQLALGEILRSGAAPDQATLRDLQAGVERASRLATQLLSLARADAEATQALTPIETLDLADFAAAQGAEWAPRMLKCGQQLQLEAPRALRARCRPLLLAEALDNLLDNARRYAGSGAVVRLIVEEIDGRPSLTVADNGPGIAANLQPTLFARFARGDHSGAGGAGLGLAIVRELLRAQHGDAEQLTAHRPGAAIRLLLPPAAQ